VAVSNTRNSRAVPCNWKYPNCGNTTRDNSGYCDRHRTLTSRISGEDLRYAGGETMVGNRSKYVVNGSKRDNIYKMNAALLESYPVITINETPSGEYRAVIQNLTRTEVAARGITLTEHHKEGAVNAVAVTRESKDDALYESTAIVADLWATRLEGVASIDDDAIDTYDSYVEAIAYARDWAKEIAEVEDNRGAEHTGRSISFSQDRRTKQLVIKIYHQPKNNPDGYVEYDHVSFDNQIKSIKHPDGSESFLPHMRIDPKRSYRVKVDPDTHEPKRHLGKDWEPVTLGLLSKVSKLVAESNKFGVSSEDGRLRLPTGWEIRSKNAES
jgi:hypothetical protein